LTSASGAPAPAPPAANPYELVPRSLVRLPGEVDGDFAVCVDGVAQSEGEDYFLVGRLLVFSRALCREGRLHYWRRVVGSWGMGATRRYEEVSIHYEAGGRSCAAHDLGVVSYGSRVQHRP
jgi:hypothetical protein